MAFYFFLPLPFPGGAGTAPRSAVGATKPRPVERSAALGPDPGEGGPDRRAGAARRPNRSGGRDRNGPGAGFPGREGSTERRQGGGRRPSALGRRQERGPAGRGRYPRAARASARRDRRPPVGGPKGADGRRPARRAHRNASKPLSARSGAQLLCAERQRNGGRERGQRPPRGRRPVPSRHRGP